MKKLLLFFVFLIKSFTMQACLRNEDFWDNNGTNYKKNLYPVLRAAEENNVLAHYVEWPYNSVPEVKETSPAVQPCPYKNPLKVSAD